MKNKLAHASLILVVLCATQLAVAREYKQILFIGNSITIHPVTDVWFAPYGMAASSPKNDYVHVLTSKIRANGSPDAQFSAFYDAAWEFGYQTFDKSKLDYQFFPLPDLVVIHLGENVNYTPDYDKSFLELTDYVRSKAPNAQIIITGSFWANHKQSDTAQKTAATLRGISFVPLAFFDSPAHRSHIGEMVTDALGHWRPVENGGVAAHQNDKAMQFMANEIFRAVYEVKSRKKIKAL